MNIAYNYNDSAAIIANNFITTEASVGIQIGQGQVNVWHNNIHGMTETGQTFSIYISEIDSVQVLNNNFSGLSEYSTGIFLQDTVFSSLSRFNYNNYYFPEGNMVYNAFSIGNNFLNSISEIQDRFPMDSNSVTYNPLYVSNTDLHIRNAILKGLGTYIPQINEDIDGDPVDPDEVTIGADITTEKIDLVPNSFVSITGNFYPGKTVEVEYKVDNSGGLDLSTISWEDKLYLSKDQNIDANDLQVKTITNDFSVDGGSSYTRKQSISIPYTSGGTYYFILNTNSSRIAFEDTTNNILVSQGRTLPNAQLPQFEGYRCCSSVLYIQW